MKLHRFSIIIGMSIKDSNRSGGSLLPDRGALRWRRTSFSLWWREVIDSNRLCGRLLWISRNSFAIEASSWHITCPDLKTDSSRSCSRSSVKFFSVRPSVASISYFGGIRGYSFGRMNNICSLTKYEPSGCAVGFKLIENEGKFQADFLRSRSTPYIALRTSISSMHSSVLIALLGKFLKILLWNRLVIFLSNRCWPASILQVLPGTTESLGVRVDGSWKCQRTKSGLYEDSVCNTARFLR